MTLEEKKVQIRRRMKRLIVPCDKLTNGLFSFPPEEYADIITNREECGCKEGVKRGKQIITPYWLELVGEYENLLPPSAFDREVLFACVSAYEQGYQVITVSMCLDTLTGGVEKYRVHKEQYSAIRDAFNKLMSLRIEIDLAPLLKAYPKYKANHMGEMRLVGTLLPCKYVEGIVNGQKTLTVKLLDESPLMTIAKIKRQFLDYDADALAIAGQRNTSTVIVLKNWLLRRIEQIRRGLNSSILFDTLYAECGLADAADSSKFNARKAIADILTAFKAEGMIRDFEIERQGRYYRAIKIIT